MYEAVQLCTIRHVYLTGRYPHFTRPDSEDGCGGASTDINAAGGFAVGGQESTVGKKRQSCTGGGLPQ